MRRRQWRQPLLDIALDVFHHHDGVVHHDADRQHHGKQRQGIDREAEHQQHGKAADNRHRHRQQRNQRRAPGLQEQNDHQHHQCDRFKQGLDHRTDRGADEHGRVVGHFPTQAGREVFGQLGHLGAHRGRDIQRVGAGCLEDRQRHRLTAIEQRTQGVFLRRQLDTRHITQAGDLAVVTGLQHDVAKGFGAVQTTLGVDRNQQVGAVRHRRCADLAGRHLHVLLLHGGDDVTRTDAQRRRPLRVDPQAHGVVTGTEQTGLTDAGNPRQLVTNVQHRVVANVGRIQAVIRRDQVHRHHQVG